MYRSANIEKMYSLATSIWTPIAGPAKREKGNGTGTNLPSRSGENLWGLGPTAPATPSLLYSSVRTVQTVVGVSLTECGSNYRRVGRRMFSGQMEISEDLLYKRIVDVVVCVF